MLNNKTKILFVIPPYFSIHERENITTILPAFTIPYGILSIDSYIKKTSSKTIETRILDLNIKQLNSLPDILSEYNPDIVAISALFDTCYNHLEPISSEVRKQLPNTIIVAGGSLPANLYKNILDKCPCIDAICYGEGEIPMKALVSTTNPRSVLETHQSWITRNTQNTKTPVNSLIDDLDEIPEFDYSIINLDNYNSRSLDKTNTNHKREMSIHTSRGCPFNCIFCANGKLHGKKVRLMSVPRVIREVKHMIKDYNLTTLIIEDDSFLIDKERAKEILKQLSELKIKVEFPNGLAVYAIDKEIGELLKTAGITVVPLAIESGSDYVLQKIIDKPLKISIIKEKVNILRKNNIRVHAFIVTGLPGETRTNRHETLMMLLNTGFDWVNISIAIPVSGSRLYDICADKNYLTTDNMSNHIIYKANIKTETFTPKEIEDFAYWLNLNVNFVNNYNMSLRTEEGYNKAIDYFQRIVEKYPEHAFAHYFLAKALQGTHVYENDWQLTRRINRNFEKFYEIIRDDYKWNKYSRTFGLI